MLKHDGTIRYQSDSVANILAYTPEELRNETYFGYTHPDDSPAVRDAPETMSPRSGDVINPPDSRFRQGEGS